VQGPTIDKMPFEEYKKLRQDNPYDIPRNPRVADLNFHSKTQEDIYTNIYLSFKKKVILHHTIDIKKMRVPHDYFGEAFAMCVEFGLLPIMQFNKDYDATVIMQFCALSTFKRMKLALSGG